MRKVKILRSNWKFRRSVQAEFQNIEVPHDWAVSGPFSGWYEPAETPNGTASSGATGGLPCGGDGFYRYEFSLPENASGKCFRLEFDGVMSHSKVFINGTLAASRAYGYSSFAVDITDLVRIGSNFIEVEISNPCFSSRWYTGAGIFREVRLIELEKEHFSWNGVRVRTKEFSPGSGSARLSVSAEGIAGEQIRTTVLRGGKVCGSGGTELALENIEAWSPENPVLYEVKISAPTDEITLFYGFRNVEFSSDNGMFLNGMPYKLKGLCMHHDLGVLGAAFSKAAARHRLKKLKAIGCNAVRTAHNPPDPKFLDLCDELGFLVIDEAFDGWSCGKTAEGYHRDFAADHKQDLIDFLKRDRNHPSVIMWSIGNEMPEQLLPEGAAIAKELADICHLYDPDRPVTASLNRAKAEDDPLLHALAEELDIIGWNYHNKIYPLLHERFRTKPQFGLETAAVYNTRGEYYYPVVTGSVRRSSMLSSAYACEYSAWSTSSESEFTALHQYPWLPGEFAWCAFDYLGEPTPYLHNWPSRSSSFGLFDFAGLPKDRVWLYAAEWHQEGTPEVLHLLPHWQWKPDEPVAVQVFTSCAQVELILNGKSLGRQLRGELPRMDWGTVVFQPGVLEAVGFDSSGREVVRTARITPGIPAEAAAELETETGDNGETLVFAKFFLKDQNGHVIETAGDMISFQEQYGELAGADNGDNRSIEPFKSHHIKLFNGFAAAVFRTAEPEKFVLTVHCGGLKSGVVKIER